MFCIIFVFASYLCCCPAQTGSCYAVSMITITLSLRHWDGLEILNFNERVVVISNEQQQWFSCWGSLLVLVSKVKNLAVVLVFVTTVVSSMSSQPLTTTTAASIQKKNRNIHWTTKREINVIQTRSNVRPFTKTTAVYACRSSDSDTSCPTDTFPMKWHRSFCAVCVKVLITFWHTNKQTHKI